MLFAALSTAAFADDTSCDAEAGRRAFVKCLICHTAAPGAGNLEGPNLWGVIDRPVGGAAGFAYSPVFVAAEFAWTREALEAYIEDPDGFLPGTRMMTARIADAEERASISCYMTTLQTTEEGRR